MADYARNRMFFASSTTLMLAVAAYMAGHIVVMRSGRITDQGDREHLLRSEEPYTQQLLRSVPDLGGMWDV